MKTFSSGPCPRCRQHISANGLARHSHAQKHYREDRAAAADRFLSGYPGGDEIDMLPWKQAKDYLRWRAERYPEQAPTYPQLRSS